jgi:hypothetical protein
VGTGNNTINPESAKKVATAVKQEKDAKASNDALAKVFKANGLMSDDKKTTTPSSTPEFREVTPEMARGVEMMREVMAREKYFDGMSNFNRSLITDPIFQSAASSILIGGISAGLNPLLFPANAKNVTLGKFLIQGSFNSGSNLLVQSSFNEGKGNIDLVDIGSAFFFKQTWQGALGNAIVSTGFDRKINGEFFAFGFGNTTKSSPQLGFEFSTNLGLGLINNKIGDALENHSGMGQSPFIENGIPFLLNTTLGAGQTISNEWMFSTNQSTIITSQDR